MHRFGDRALSLDQGCLKADGKVDELTKAYVELAQSGKHPVFAVNSIVRSIPRSHRTILE